MNPKYGAFSFLGSKRIKIYKSSPTQSNLKLKPGVIEISETGELLVGCKNHTVLKIDEIPKSSKIGEFWTRFATNKLNFENVE